MRRLPAKLKTVLAFLLAAGALTLLAGLGVLGRADRAFSDALYQHPVGTDGRVVILGIDQRALEAYGPYQTWCRAGVARALELLNADEENRPAAIGVDVLFAGEADPEADAALAAAARAGNVVTACAAGFTAGFAERDGVFFRDEFLLTSFEEPFAALRAASRQGHINAMLDSDGILRHHLLYIDLPDGARVPSMALALAGEDVQLPPVDAHGFWYLPYSKKTGDFEVRSLADLLEGRVAPSYFAGKTVLIGPCAAGLQDSYFTSMDHARPMYGVEYQANAVEALRSGFYKRQAADGVQLAILFALLFGACAGFWRRGVRPATALWLLIAAGWVLVCRLLFEAGWVLHVLWVPAGVTVLYAGCLAANYLTAALERQRVTRTFRRYVAPEIVTEILGAGPEALALGGQKRDIAVLFVDIRGFTSMSEQLGDPALVVEILNEYLTLTTRCVMEQHGTLDKFVGDCTMAFWNAPLAQEDYVMLACRAAKAMAEGARPLAEKLQERYGRTVAFGVGVHMGPAVVGNIGAPMRMDYTAIGDTVNTAARLEANAGPGQIFISRAVADALAGRIRATPLAHPPRLKGKEAGFEILTLDEILVNTD